jgi:hypothetical protein
MTTRNAAPDSMAIERQALTSRSKSDGMRLLLDSGYSVAQIARVMNAPYGFVYGVAKRAGKVETAAARRGGQRRPPTKPTTTTNAASRGAVGGDELADDIRGGTSIEIRRISSGPSLLIEDAERLVMAFFRTDPSSAPGGYDDLAGRGDRDRVTRADIVAINTTMRARSPHHVWEALIGAAEPQAWLLVLDPTWGLVELDDDIWQEKARPAVEHALTGAIAPGRGLSVATKVLHLKRPRMFPVLDSLVLQQLGVTDSVPTMKVMDHLRAEGRRNLDALVSVQANVAKQYDRSLVRILDVLLWTSHPAAGMAPTLRGWQHVLRREP